MWQRQQRSALPSLEVDLLVRGEIQVSSPNDETLLCLGRPTPLSFKSSVDVAFMQKTAEELESQLVKADTPSLECVLP